MSCQCDLHSTLSHSASNALGALNTAEKLRPQQQQVTKAGNDGV